MDKICEAILLGISALLFFGSLSSIRSTRYPDKLARISGGLSWGSIIFFYFFRWEEFAVLAVVISIILVIRYTSAKINTDDADSYERGIVLLFDITQKVGTLYFVIQGQYSCALLTITVLYALTILLGVYYGVRALK